MWGPPKAERRWSRPWPSAAAGNCRAWSPAPGWPGRPRGPVRCWPRSTTSARSISWRDCDRCSLRAGRPWPSARTRPRCSRPFRPSWWRGFLAHDEDGARALGDEVGSLVTYPAAKLAVAHWVRRNATGAEWAGSGRASQRRGAGDDRDPDGGRHAVRSRTGPLLDLLPIPVGRAGRPDEIAALIQFLLGPDSAFFCGSVVFCDGGSDALLRTTDWPAAWDISVRHLGQQLRPERGSLGSPHARPDPGGHHAAAREPGLQTAVHRAAGLHPGHAADRGGHPVPGLQV